MYVHSLPNNFKKKTFGYHAIRHLPVANIHQLPLQSHNITKPLSWRRECYSKHYPVIRSRIPKSNPNAINAIIIRCQIDFRNHVIELLVAV